MNVEFNVDIEDKRHLVETLRRSKSTNVKRADRTAKNVSRYEKQIHIKMTGLHDQCKNYSLLFAE